jgi:hypothetical protein
MSKGLHYQGGVRSCKVRTIDTAIMSRTVVRGTLFVVN